MQKSYCAPDFRSAGSVEKHKKYGKMNGTNHIDIGWIACRVFKAISYGQTGITNCPRAKEILGDHVEFCPDPKNVLDIATRRLNDTEWRKNAMLHIKNNHTYIHRIRDMARALLKGKSS